jgi:hypothetical protein
MLRTRLVPAGFVEPCLLSPADRPPSGPGWVHEIKHDDFRMMVRRDPAGIRLLTRNGHDWTQRYPLIAAAVEALRVRSCLIEKNSAPPELSPEQAATWNRIIGRLTAGLDHSRE